MLTIFKNKNVMCCFINFYIIINIVIKREGCKWTSRPWLWGENVSGCLIDGKGRTVPAPIGSTHLQWLQLHSGAPGFSASVRLCCTVLCTCLFLAMWRMNVYVWRFLSVRMPVGSLSPTHMICIILLKEECICLQGRGKEHLMLKNLFMRNSLVICPCKFVFVHFNNETKLNHICF